MPISPAMASNTICSMICRAVPPLNAQDITGKIYPMLGHAWAVGTLCASQDSPSARELVCVSSCWCWHHPSSPRRFKSPVLHWGAWALAHPGSKAGGAEQPTLTMLVQHLQHLCPPDTHPNTPSTGPACFSSTRCSCSTL